MHTREIKVNAAALCALLLLSAVSLQGAGDCLYRDRLGRAVTVKVPVKRAVLLSTYELIPLLDCWDSVVGVGRWAYDNDLMKAVRPGIRRITSVGTGTDVNMEALMALRPDLVITWTFKPEQVRFIESRGVRVIAVYPDSLSELYDVMRMHGRIFRKEARIERAIGSMERIFAVVRKHAGDVKHRRKVLWLGSRKTSVACGKGLTNEMITMIGGVNPAAEIGERNADVPLERIVRWNPDVIFIWGSAKYDAKHVLASPQLKSVAAVRAGRVYKSPRWSTWSPRVAPVVLWMAAKVYPERYAKAKVDEMIEEFYIKTFAIPYGKVEKIED